MLLDVILCRISPAGQELSEAVTTPIGLGSGDVTPVAMITGKVQHSGSIVIGPYLQGHWLESRCLVSARLNHRLETESLQTESSQAESSQAGDHEIPSSAEPLVDVVTIPCRAAR